MVTLDRVTEGELTMRQIIMAAAILFAAATAPAGAEDVTWFCAMSTHHPYVETGLLKFRIVGNEMTITGLLKFANSGDMLEGWAAYRVFEDTPVRLLAVAVKPQKRVTGEDDSAVRVVLIQKQTRQALFAFFSTAGAEGSVFGECERN
jgi:hypothetical protein